MAGEKLQLLVIRKYANPRAFKRANRLLVEYRANRKACLSFQQSIISCAILCVIMCTTVSFIGISRGATVF
jgi:hypothetical protein